MDHTPFIIGSYVVAALVLGWTAVAPVLRGRRFAREWLARLRVQERRQQESRKAEASHASET
jgi:hypothetical protein